jgi:hypothetical protein
MGKKSNLTGLKFGRLTGISEAGKNDKGATLWRFACDCGAEVVAIGASVKYGNTSSCGCLKAEVTALRNTTHAMSKHPAYENWKSMFKRCYNKNDKRYEYYGARGIGVDPHFNYFPNFLAEIGEKPSEDTTWTVGRKDNNLGYQPGNIRWETTAEQARNHSMQKNNTSGIVGVKLEIKINKHGRYGSWVAYYKDHTGRSVTKNFSINKYGYEEAKRLAVQAREEGLRRLEEQGIVYAETHGAPK